MEPVEDVYFYTKDWVPASENYSQDGVLVEKRIEQVEKKLKWLEKRMLGLEFTCYSKEMKDVASEEDVNSEDDVVNVSSEEDEAAPLRCKPSSSKAAPIRATPSTSKIMDDQPIKCSEKLKVKTEDMDDQPSQCPEMLQVHSIPSASHGLKRPRGRPPKRARPSGPTTAAAPKRPRGRPPSTKKNVQLVQLLTKGQEVDLLHLKKQLVKGKHPHHKLLQLQHEEARGHHTSLE
ncbi:hypothetical protein CTI12_AA115470 [Artemisia annua]|uniref:Uncharacterized protein n=1 Tax=Artemisia annua TaxID=35608 RepID=A0A2U1PT66_ARTAN|nr:hypothetical protein CTI12_AA115470 [Artemisia annua]